MAWADEVVVLDCGSTDGTRELAAAAGAVVHEQPWAGFSAQKNAAARLATNDWVLSLDADEIVTPPLARSIEAALAAPDPADGYAVHRRSDFLGALLPSAGKPFVRLYHRARSAWDEDMTVHEAVRVPGRVHVLDGALLHWNDQSIDELAVLFNRYATDEARELDRRGVRARPARHRPAAASRASSGCTSRAASCGSACAASRTRG